MAENLVRRRMKSSPGDRVLYAVVYTIIIVFLLLVLYPILFVISASFSEGTEVQLGHVYLWPVKPTLEGYNAVFSHRNVLTGYRNTIFYTLAGTAINVVVTVLCAIRFPPGYAHARILYVPVCVHDVLQRRFNPHVSAGEFAGHGQHRVVAIDSGAMSVYNMIITRTFFQNTVPKELLKLRRSTAARTRAISSISYCRCRKR